MEEDKRIESDQPTKIGVHYQRSRHYRTVVADGAQFGITPRGRIQFTLYTDQASFPEFVVHAVDPEGKVGAVLEEVKKEGLVREVAVNVIMDVATATSFIKVFQEMMEERERIRREAEEKRASKPEAE